MATATEHDTTVTRLVSDIVTDAMDLVKQQAALLRQEVIDDISRTKSASASLAIGAGMGLVGVILLCLMLVYLLAWAFPDLPLWGAYGIVGGALAILGGILVKAATEKFKSFNPLPDESASALKENVQWIRQK